MTAPFLHPNASLVEDCVHCGFCLAACPTYALWAEETDSPRGRIYLLNQALHGAPVTDETVVHFDRCLSCMACVTACPSGVQYDALITKTRAEIDANYRRPWRDRLLRGAIFSVFCYPRRLEVVRALLYCYERSGLKALVRASRLLTLMPSSIQTMEAVAPKIEKREALATFVPGLGQKRGVVGMLTGCIQSVLFPDVNAATARVLSAEGFDVVIPKHQGCCGALSGHSGRSVEAKAFARSCIDAFSAAEIDVLIVNSAGCGSAIKEYGELLADEPDYAARAEELAHRSRDVTEFLTEQGSRATRHPLPITVAYHDACHLSHAQGIRAQPRQLLSEIPGLILREIENGEICCGSAGVYNLLEADAARGIGDMKAAAVNQTGAEVLVAGNPGCLMQINAALSRQHADIKVAHTIQVIDASINDHAIGAGGS